MYTIKHSVFACFLAFVASAATAQDIELYSSDGSLSLRGPLIDFTDQKYTIDTLIGRITLDSASVLCRGEACPEIVPPISEFSIAGVDRPVRNLVSDLLPAYAESLGGQLKKTDDAGEEIFNLSDEDNELIATVSLIDSASAENLSPLFQQEAATIALTSQSSISAELPEPEITPSISQASAFSQVIGLEAIAVVTAESNPVDSISMADLAKVFTGNYTNWSELGGPDAPIKLYGPQSDSELTRLFVNRVLGSEDNELSRLDQNILAVENIAEQVSSDPNGIGYTHFTKSEPAKNLAIKSVCGIVTAPNGFTVKAEEYPLTYRYYAHRVGQTDGEQVDTLLRFLQSDQGQDIVTAHGLVNQRYVANSISNQGFRFANAIATSTTSVTGDLLREMVTEIIDSERLSITFRFETGANKLDKRAAVDIVRLADKLRLPSNANKKIQLLGFTDSVGDFDLNLELSLRRANQIRDALIDIDSTLASRVNIRASGFGEISPIACNETAPGRTTNRRVEVWMGKNR